MNTLAPDWRARPGLFATCVLVFAASTWVTILWCGAACDMPGMGTWHRLPDQSRVEHFLAFAGMWLVMMIAMMMPVFVPALWRFRGSLPGRATASRRCLATFAVAYFAAWASLGMVLYPLGVGISRTESRWLSFAGGLVVILAGMFQFTRAKRRHIECCRVAPLRPGGGAVGSAVGLGEAWRRGWRTGVDCVVCCAGLTATLLIVGVMDLLAMAAVTVGIAAERLMPARWRMARAVGWVLLTLGVFLCLESFR